MNFERSRFLGQREEWKMQAVRLEASIHALSQSIRTEINPFSDIEGIDAARLYEQAYELSEKIQKYKEVRAKIRTISRELGDRTNG